MSCWPARTPLSPARHSPNGWKRAPRAVSKHPESVSWIRLDPVPNWLEVARQYTERWTHHQQIRDAVGVPGLEEPAFEAPVLATFVQALPRAFTDVPASVGTTVEVVIAGEAGGCWVLTRTQPRQRSRSRVIGRLACRSWTPLPSSAEWPSPQGPR